MRKFFIVCAFLLAFSFTGFSQDELGTPILTETAKSEKAEKIDEFGSVGECELRARLDGFLTQLQNDPNLRGVVIVYQGKNVLPANYEAAARLYENHFRFRGFDTSRIEVKSSFREERFTELWTVPNGFEPPEPTDTIPQPKIPNNKTFLYDHNFISGSDQGDYSEEFILPSVLAQQEAEQKAYEEASRAENAVEETPVEEAVTQNTVDETQNVEKETPTVEEETEIEKPTPEELEEAKFHWTNEKFGELIKNRKDARGVIIFYADDAYYDVGKLQSHVEDGKRRIAEAAKISPDKIQVVFGGYRGSIEAEFWIVPKKGETPKPTPEERPIEEKSVEEEKLVAEENIQ